MSIKTTYHRDGTITYWSVYSQMWIKRASVIPDRELAAMPSGEREKAQRHLVGECAEAPGKKSENCLAH